MPGTISFSDLAKFHPGQYPGGIPRKRDEDGRWKLELNPELIIKQAGNLVVAYA